MTSEEHQLILTMLAQQMLAISVLLDMLHDKGVIEEDDFAAFHAISVFGKTHQDVLSQLGAEYDRLARQLGIVIQPPKAPPVS